MDIVCRVIGTEGKWKGAISIDGLVIWQGKKEYQHPWEAEGAARQHFTDAMAALLRTNYGRCNVSE